MSSPISSLTEQIEKLGKLQKEVHRLRTIPIALLQPGGNGEPVSAADALKAVRQIGDEGLSDDIQGALRRARESLASDEKEVKWTRHQEKRKPRREPAAVSGDDRERGIKSAFPTVAEAGVKMEGLGVWAREFNRTHKCKLRMQGEVIRLTIPDVMTVYLSFGVEEGEGEIRVETIRVFGPREAKGGPYGQSAYRVFQLVTQQLGKVMEQTEGRIKLQSLVELVAGYETLFISSCRVCGRVISPEGHVPAIVRRWDGGQWIGEHVTCTPGLAVG